MLRKKTQKGGFLCSSGNPKDKYTIDIERKLGSGEEGIAYIDKTDENVVIKEYFSILLTPGYRKKISYLKNIFDMNKFIGDIGLGPKVYYYKICKKTFTVNLNTITSVARSRLAGKFYNIPETAKIIRTAKTQPNGVDYIFSYEAYVPYLVMEKINGHKITNEELEVDTNMEKIYQMYITLYNQDIIMQDLHKGNIIINPKTQEIYFIDSGAYRAIEKPTLLTKDELKENIKNPNDEWIHNLGSIADLPEGDVEMA
jgi:serine/threonine protein kinase